MAGIQELLTLVFLIVVLLFIPRLFRKGRPSGKKMEKKLSLSGKMRVGIVLSVAAPLVVAFILKPWDQNFLLFLMTGVLPVAAGWAGLWIYKGFKKIK